jgi:hypothetical protein
MEDETSHGLTTFEWEWSDPVPPEFGFEIRVWREGEPPLGAHDAMADNQQHRIEQVGPAQYRLSIDITDAAGVRGRGGEYFWTVVLVRISPVYQDTGQQAAPDRFQFVPNQGGDDNNPQDNGGDNGGSIT